MKIPCRLHEAEEIISEMDLYHVADDIMESEEDYRIVISGWWVHIHSNPFSSSETELNTVSV